jgi:hypothetical protein
VSGGTTTVGTVDNFQAEVWGVGDKETLAEIDLSI